MSDREQMTDGEKMVYAAAFALAVGYSYKTHVAVKAATLAVHRLREASVDACSGPGHGLTDNERAMLATMSGR